MSVRVKNYSTNGIEQPEWTDSTIDQRTAFDSDGYAYVFGINEVKNVLDDGRGAAVAAFSTVVDTVEDPIPFGTSRA